MVRNLKRNMKMKQNKTRSFAYITWIDEKSAKVSLKPPPTFMPGILLHPTRIITWSEAELVTLKANHNKELQEQKRKYTFL